MGNQIEDPVGLHTSYN